MTQTPPPESHTRIDYADPTTPRSAKLAVVAFLLMLVAAPMLGFAAIEASSDGDIIGFASMPIALLGAVLSFMALRRRSGPVLLRLGAAGLALVYWAAVAALIVPKLLSSGS